MAVKPFFPKSLIKQALGFCIFKLPFRQEGLPWWLRGKESACQCRRCRFNSWVGKIPPEKEMATHSSILARVIPWTEDPGSYSPWGRKRVGHNLVTKQQHTQKLVILVPSNS